MILPSAQYKILPFEIIMSFSIILERFIEQSPIPVMVRSLIERTLNADRINACFESVGENPQYTRELLFSSVFELMSLVVLRAFPAIHSANIT